MAQDERTKRLTQTLQTLTKLFDCPVCFERITPPVSTCINGHAVCLNCRKQLHNCPTCKATFSPYKNTMLDQIIDENIFPCKYTDKGCQTEAKYKELDEHERRTCKYRTISCDIEGCACEVSIYRYYEHVFVTHASDTIRFRVENHRIFDISKSTKATHVLRDEKSDRIVFETVKLDSVVQKFYVTCQYVGTKEEADGFTYELRIYDRNHQSPELRFRSLCIPVGLSEVDIERHPCCLVLDSWVLKSFTRDDRLFYSVKIEEVPRKWYQVLRDKCKFGRNLNCRRDE